MSYSDERSPEELLQSALSSAFTPVSIAPVPPDSSSSDTRSTLEPSEAPAPAAQSEPLVTPEDLKAYEQERLALEASWKAESTLRRREAEERRARIAAEKVASGKTRDGDGEDIKGPPNLVFSPKNVEGKGYPGEPSIVDVRGAVSGEPANCLRHAETSAQASPPLEHSQQTRSTWEEAEIESLESSYPSLSFPENSQSDSAPSAPSSEHAPLSPNSRHKSKSTHTSKTKDKTDEKAPSSPKAAAPAEPLPSQTLSIFDARLSTRTRLLALLSSLSINLLLPFINGVMLGFGEIFARNMARRFFGWSIPVPGEEKNEERRGGRPGGAATAVGVRASGSEGSRLGQRRRNEL